MVPGSCAASAAWLMLRTPKRSRGWWERGCLARTGRLHPTPYSASPRPSPNDCFLPVRAPSRCSTSRHRTHVAAPTIWRVFFVCAPWRFFQPRGPRRAVGGSGPITCPRVQSHHTVRRVRGPQASGGAAAQPAAAPAPGPHEREGGAAATSCGRQAGEEAVRGAAEPRGVLVGGRGEGDLDPGDVPVAAGPGEAARRSGAWRGEPRMTG